MKRVMRNFMKPDKALNPFINRCFSDLRHVNANAIKEYAMHLKEICEVMHATGVSPFLPIVAEKRSAQRKGVKHAFCTSIIRLIIASARETVSFILKKSNLSLEETVTFLIHLAYIAQSLIALTGIQQRFGGRLSYHCLLHSLKVVLSSVAYCQGTHYEFVVLCAAANHDAILCYYDLPAGTQVKRKTGWSPGESEFESCKQMEAQLLEIKNMIIEAGSLINQEAIKCFTNKFLTQETLQFLRVLIRNTIPSIKHIALQKFGRAVCVIHNQTIIPFPSDFALLSEPLRVRLIVWYDRVFCDLFNYIKSINKDDQPIIMNVHSIDSMLQLQKIPQQVIVASLARLLLEDMRRNDLFLFKYFLDNVIAQAVSLSDLDSFMKTVSCEERLLQEEAIALIVEDYPYQASLFFSVHRKLVFYQKKIEEKVNEKVPKRLENERMGLSDEAIHLKLNDPFFRKERNIYDSEYERMVEFKSLVSDFLIKQSEFCEGRRYIVQHYIYEPMKALQILLGDSEVQGLLQKQATLQSEDNETYQMDIRQCIQNFENVYCEQGQLCTTAISSIQSFISGGPTAGTLCDQIIITTSHRLGKSFPISFLPIFKHRNNRFAG